MKRYEALPERVVVFASPGDKLLGVRRQAHTSPPADYEDEEYVRADIHAGAVEALEQAKRDAWADGYATGQADAAKMERLADDRRQGGQS